MYWAISQRTSASVVASRELRFNRDRYTCPGCGSPVTLRAGLVREPYFAHNAHKADEDCEQYFPGEGSYSGDTFGGAVYRPRVVELPERGDAAEAEAEFSPVLSVRFCEDRFALVISIPPLEGLEDVPFRELQNIKLRVVAGTRFIKQFSAIELYTGEGRATFEVPPTENAYRIEPSTDGTLFQPNDLHGIEGLTPGGTMFCDVAGEWHRIPQHTQVGWGETLYFLAQHAVTIPAQCSPRRIGEAEGFSRVWTLWGIQTPRTPSNAVVEWIEKIGYAIAEPRWRLEIVSVPADFDSVDRSYFFPREDIAVCKAVPPYPNAEVRLLCGVGKRISKHPLKANRNADPLYFSFDPPTGKACTLSLEDYPETARVIRSVSISDGLPRQNHGFPSLQLRIGDECYVAGSPGPLIEVDPKRLRRGMSLELVGPTGEKLELKVGIFFRGASFFYIPDRTLSSTEGELGKIFKNHREGLVTIDAGPLGSIDLNIRSRSGATVPPRRRARIVGWLSVLADSADCWIEAGVGGAALRARAGAGALQYENTSRFSSNITPRTRVLAKRRRR